MRNYHGVIVAAGGLGAAPPRPQHVTAVRTAVASADRALQLPPRLLDSVEQTLRTVLTHAADAAQHGLLDADLSNVGARIAELQRVTADFCDALGQLVQSDVTKDDVFDGNRDRVVEALRQFARECNRAQVRVDAARTAAGPRRIWVHGTAGGPVAEERTPADARTSSIAGVRLFESADSPLIFPSTGRGSSCDVMLLRP